MAGIGDDRLRDLHFAEIEVEKRPVIIDRGRADDGEIDLELTDEIDSGLADNTAVRAADHTAGNHDLELRINT